MKTFTLILEGVKKYWTNPALVRIIMRWSKWDEPKVKAFLSQSEYVNITKQTPEETRGFLEDLEKAGFQIDLLEVQSGIRARISIPHENILDEIKAQLKEIREQSLYSVQEQLRKISETLETQQKPKPARELLKGNAVYQKLIAAQQATSEEKMNEPVRQAAQPPKVIQPKFTPTYHSEKKSTTEADIGKYWLSKIGIFTLLLGVVFLITYTSQFLGAWGKLAIGGFLGVVLVGAGNYLTSKENYHKWAMSAIGGGWAILYFTVFAAYHVPLVKVIQNPYLGFFCLLVAASAFIGQSLKYRSSALAFMAYFLAYFATVSTHISFYTLAASYLLGVSAVFVTRKQGWNWLALLCLPAIYGIHWVWVEPSIYAAQEHFTSQGQFWSLIFSPWTNGSWQIYPLIDRTKSYLHLAFLALYWGLFTLMNLLRCKEEKSDNVVTAISLVNGLVFIYNTMHHLHTYYPATKWIFSVLLGAAYLCLSLIESKKIKSVLSDIYLVFSVSLFCLIIPMYFNGVSISYGWSAASAGLIWLGLFHKRMVLRVIGWILAAVVACRMVLFDYFERDVLFKFIFPVYPFLFIGLFAGAAFYLIGRFYEHSAEGPKDEKFFGGNIAFITSAACFSIAPLMGGLRDIASSCFVLVSLLLMWAGVRINRPALRSAAVIFLIPALYRFVAVDSVYNFSRYLEGAVMLRYLGAGASVGLMFAAGEWLRRMAKTLEFDIFYFHFYAVSAGVVFLVLAADPMTKAILSLIWGSAAFISIMYGFKQKERTYRWMGLGVFVLVVVRLFAYDFAQLQVLHRIISFIGIGLVFIIASFLYSYYSKIFLSTEQE